jgi:N-acetylmuramoyl-L-alanine amidase
MRIDNHRLQGDGILYRASPNQGGLFQDGILDTIVLHFTAGDSVNWALDNLRDSTPGQRVSAHLLVARDGTTTQLLPFDTVAWHAGRSCWGGRSEFNHFSLGIEIDNAGRLQQQGDDFSSWTGGLYEEQEAVQAFYRDEAEPSWWHRYPGIQLEVVENLCLLLIKTYHIDRILGHEEIAPERKEDPGPAFPLDALRQRLLPAPLVAYEDSGNTPSA